MVIGVVRSMVICDVLKIIIVFKIVGVGVRF